MEVSIEIITPENAANYLRLNNGNRKLDKNIVDTYAKDMANGKWVLNGESLKFNKHGELLDGQHRLAACVKAGIEFESVVVRDLPKDVFKTLDSGKRRSASDVLTIAGETNTKDIASIVKKTLALKRDMTITGYCGFSMLTNAHILYEYQKNRELYDQCIKTSNRLYRTMRLFEKGVIGGFIAFLSLYKQYPMTTIMPFFESLHETKDSLNFRITTELRKMIVNNFTKLVKLTPQARMNAMIFAWNCYISCNTERTFRGIDLTKKQFIK